MPSDVLTGLLWTLALCGFLALADMVWRLLRRLFRSGSSSTICVLVLVQNQEEQVEGTVQTLAALLRRLPPSAPRCELTIIDIASADRTADIIERIARRDSLVGFIRLFPEQLSGVFRIAQERCKGNLAVLLDLRGRLDPGEDIRKMSKKWV